MNKPADDRFSMGVGFDLTRPVKNYAHSIREEIWGVLLFVGVVWGVFFLGWVIPLDFLELIPRQWSRLPGILSLPFLHRDLGHLLSNTFPLIVLMALLAGSRANSYRIVFYLVLVSGGLLWLFGRNGTGTEPIAHVGASVLVFGLITYLIASGLFERRLVPLLIAILVGFLYGGTVLWEPFRAVFSRDQAISWEGHFFGAIAGVIVAYAMTKPSYQDLAALPRQARQMVGRVGHWFTTPH